MIWRIKEKLLELKLRRKCQAHEVVRKGHWRYYRKAKTTRIQPHIVSL